MNGEDFFKSVQGKILGGFLALSALALVIYNFNRFHHNYDEFYQSEIDSMVTSKASTFAVNTGYEYYTESGHMIFMRDDIYLDEGDYVSKEANSWVISIRYSKSGIVMKKYDVREQSYVE
ncbi:hypothetical protein [Algivirga pacifica]|uniref:Uncharacterized protein n=1 Tax=Algivirga pacifica TaxID=1162670 RepID=A0ABP9D462_9BACT